MSAGEKVTFIAADGESELAARLDLPAGRPRAYALFAHCFTCNQNILTASRVAEGLTRDGIAVLRFDFTGLGASEGEFANTNFSSNVGDLLAAASWLRQERQAPTLLVGHSLGGAAVLAAAASIPEARAVCVIGAPAEPAHLRRHLKGVLPEIEANGEADFEVAGRTYRIRKQFLEDIDSHRLEPAIANLGKALLVVHSAVDEEVALFNGERIFAAAKPPKTFIVLDKADHLLSRRDDGLHVTSVIATWAEKYLGLTDTFDNATMRAPSDAVLVTDTGNGRYTQSVSVGGRHRLTADEPEAYGGNDWGPSPYELLLASLGACTSMTLRMYAERKGLKLARSRVTLRHDKIHAQDCADCETRVGTVDRIERDIELEGRLDEDARAKLLEIADKCPVHRTLNSEVKIVTRLK